jgi:hypothetical protein
MSLDAALVPGGDLRPGLGRLCPIAGRLGLGRRRPAALLVPCPPHPPAGLPGFGVSLGPAWSPGARDLAYVTAPITISGGWPSLAWYDAHELVLWDVQTHRSRDVAGASGASVPVWSSNGKYLLFVKDDGLFMDPARGGDAVDVAGPLYSPAQWRSSYAPSGPPPRTAYFGQIPRIWQFAWWSPANSKGRSAL